MTGRWLRASLFGTASTSWQALAIFAPAGMLIILLSMPADPVQDATSPTWWSIALASQAVFSAVVLGASLITRQMCSPWARIGALALAGAIRGMVIGWASTSLALPMATSTPVAIRALNSAIVCTLALGAIGFVLQGRRDFRADYAKLLSEAIAMHRAAMAREHEIDPEVLRHWEQAQASVREVSTQALAHLEPGSADLQAAAVIIADAVSRDVRPLSHRMWFGRPNEAPRLRLSSIIRQCLRPWRPPVGEVMLVLSVISIVGSIARAGFVIGPAYSLVSLLACWGVLAGSVRLARERSRAGTLLGVCTLVAMALAVLVVAIVMGAMLGTAPDVGGALTGAVTAPIVVLTVLVLHRMNLERGILLAALVDAIDADALRLRARLERISEGVAALGAYLHHSVQSELSAVALGLGEGARGTDLDAQVAAREAARHRLDRLVALQPPWARQSHPRDRLLFAIDAWQGLAQIDVHLPAQDDATDAQWQVAALAVEEAIANAVRSGRARMITVSGSGEGGDLLIVVADDGLGAAPGSPGLGTSWLEQHLPGAWSRETSPSGTTLTLRIR